MSATSMPREANRSRVPSEMSSDAEEVELDVVASARCEKRRRMRESMAQGLGAGGVGRQAAGGSEEGPWALGGVGLLRPLGPWVPLGPFSIRSWVLVSMGRLFLG